MTAPGGGRRRRAESARVVAVSSSRDATPGRSRFPRHVGLALVGAAVVAAYVNSLPAGLVHDSHTLIADNPLLREPSAGNVWTLLTKPYWHPFANDGTYRPLTTLSYLLNGAVLGPAPIGYHAVNLLLHLGSTGLVYVLVDTLVGRASVAVLAAAIFGLHPITTEAVTNVVGRADLLATCGVIGGLVCYVRATASDVTRPTEWRAGLVVAAALAAFSKENGVMLLPAIVLYDVVLRARERRPPVRLEHALVAAIAVALLGARWAAGRAGELLADLSPVDNPIVEAGFWAGRLTAIKVVGRQLALLLWPRTLSADYSFAQIPIVQLPPRTWEDWQAVLALVAIAALVLGAVRARRAAPALAFFVALGLVMLLPTANLLVVIGSIMAERFLYLPLVGFAAALAIVCDRAVSAIPAPGRAIAASVVVLVLVAAGWRTAVRNRDWRDETRLAERTVEAAPRSAKAQMGWAMAQFADDPGHERLDRIVAAGERAVAIRGDYLQALVNLGLYYCLAGERAGEGDEARKRYAQCAGALERAAALDAAENRRFRERLVASGRAGGGIPETGHPELYENLGHAYTRLGRSEDAVRAHREARRIEPGEVRHYVDIADGLVRLGHGEDAAVTLLEAITLRPHDREAAGRLVEVYAKLDPGRRAVGIDDAGRLRMDLDDPTLRRRSCDGLVELVEIFMRSNQPRVVAQLQALERGRCGKTPTATD